MPASCGASSRKERCDIIHAHGRAPAWSAWIASRLTGIPFVTSWYKGFREQNLFKRLYNSVMARGDRIIAVSDQLAELISHRYGIPWGRINVVPLSIDLQRFDPDTISQERVEAIRRAFGVEPGAKLILVTGRLLRRKGHHLVVQAVHRLKEMGLKDFVCVFAGEDHGKSRYTGELWDLVLATKTADVIRMTGPVDDLAGGLCGGERRGLGRHAGRRLAAHHPGSAGHGTAGDRVRSRRRTGSGAGAAIGIGRPDDRLALFGRGRCRAGRGPDPAVFDAGSRPRAIGLRGRNWVTSHFDASAVADLTLRLYAEVVRLRKS